MVAIILRKSHQLLRHVNPEVRRTLASVADRAILLSSPADRLRELPDGSVSLVVTSPPFLDVVNYGADNWLLCWFVGIDPKAMQLTIIPKLTDWGTAMEQALREIHRVLKPGGHVAFEVGEVRWQDQARGNRAAARGCRRTPTGVRDDQRAAVY